MKTFDLQLWHSKKPTFKAAEFLPPDLTVDYSHVCDFVIEAFSGPDAMNKAFDLSQNLEKAWGDGKHRSTSVGDLFVRMNPTTNTGSEVWCVDNIGFAELKNEELALYEELERGYSQDRL